MQWAALGAVTVLLTGFVLGTGGGTHASDAAGTDPVTGLGGLSYVPPDPPSIDVDPFLADYKDFVKTYPKRQNNHLNHVGARNAIAAEFAGAGLTVWRQPFSNGISQENVCGVKLGTVDAQTWIVVGGHMDSTTWDGWAIGNQPGTLHAVSEGAYDNGAGTRLAVALAIAYAPLNSAYSILFCTFDGEERGLQGSAKVKQAMDNDLGPGGFPWAVSDVRAMMNMDMFGINWPVRAPIYAEIRSDHAALRSQVDAIRVAQGVPNAYFKFSGLILGQSDNKHWHQAGVPTVFYISDFQELGVPASNNVPSNVPLPATPNGAYPFWHHDDTWETMFVMAGGDAALAASFQVALNIASETLAVMALHPEIAL